MKREIASAILANLVQPKIWTTVDEYANSRIEEIRTHLDHVHSWEEVKVLQGRIEELKVFLKLRETAKNVVELENKRRD